MARGRTKATTRWMAGATHPSKEGTFTAYCGGTVTDACIDRGMRSNNKTTQARAKFAEAARSVARKHRR